MGKHDENGRKKKLDEQVGWVHSFEQVDIYYNFVEAFFNILFFYNIYFYINFLFY